MSDSVRLWIRFGIALIVLNVGLSFHNIWPTPWVTVRPEISMEIAALVVLLGAYQLFRGVISDRTTAFLAGALLLMVLGRYLEVTAPALFGRRINLYWDVQYIPDVAAMLARSAPPQLIVAIAVAIPVILAAVFFALYWSLQQVRARLAQPRPARYMSALMAVVVTLYYLGYYGAAPTLHWFSIPLYQTYSQQFAFVSAALGGESAIEDIPNTTPITEIDPALLPGSDFILTFIESYGATAFDNVVVADLLDDRRHEFAAVIEATDRNVLSAFVTAPTFGGASWLSHASFMTGLKVSSNAMHNVLLTQTRPTLAGMLSERGFRSVALMPGLKNHWPEGAFYGFDQIYGAEDLAWAGPEFGWWRIPDQYALARLDELELTPRVRAPVFVFFPTISTHMPFRPTPPYQPDWQQMISDAPFTPADLGDSLVTLPDYSNLIPDYAAVLEYTYSYWSGYLSERAEQDFLLVLIGDHQPPAAVSGEGERWDVPVHVVTRDAALAVRLRERGFEPGLAPAPEAIAELHELPLLLFGR